MRANPILLPFWHKYMCLLYASLCVKRATQWLHHLCAGAQGAFQVGGFKSASPGESVGLGLDLPQPTGECMTMEHRLLALQVASPSLRLRLQSCSLF